MDEKTTLLKEFKVDSNRLTIRDLAVSVLLVLAACVLFWPKISLSNLIYKESKAYEKQRKLNAILKEECKLLKDKIQKIRFFNNYKN